VKSVPNRRLQLAEMGSYAAILLSKQKGHTEATIKTVHLTDVNV
jgi:hypothetical protein